MLEGVSGIGLIIGLMGGSILYESMGYRAVFITFGSLLIVVAVITRFCFQALAKKDLEDFEQSQRQLLLEEENQERQSNGETNSVFETKESEQERLDDDGFQRQHVSVMSVSYIKLLCMPRVIFAMLAGAFGNFVFC